MPITVPALDFADKFKLRQAAKNDAQYGLNVLKYLVQVATGDPVTVGDVAIWFDANIGGLFRDLLCAAATYWGYGVTKYGSGGTTPTPEFYCKTNRALGNGGNNLLPTQSAFLSKFTTSLSGRKYRGRIYFPFGDTDAINADGSLTNATKAAIAAFMTAMGGDGNTIVIPNAGNTGTIDCRLVITDKTLSRVTAVANFIVRNFCGTQRRRAEINRGDTDPFAGSVEVPI